MNPSDPSAPAIERWIAAFREALGAASPSAAVHRPPGTERAGAAEEGGWIWWSQTLSLFPEPAIWIGASAESWTALDEALRSGSTDPHQGEGIAPAIRDLLTRAAEAAASVSAAGARPQVLSTEPVTGPGLGGSFEVALAITVPGRSEEIDLVAAFSENLIHCSAVVAASAAPQSVGTLQLPVHVTLGRTTMFLRDVYKLTVGSVVEFRRLVTDPVDIMVKDAVIARGQVVVGSGNYGVKILAIEPNEIAGGER